MRQAMQARPVGFAGFAGFPTPLAVSFSLNLPLSPLTGFPDFSIKNFDLKSRWRNTANPANPAADAIRWFSDSKASEDGLKPLARPVLGALALPACNARRLS
jgi:hypothetical protein